MNLSSIPSEDLAPSLSSLTSNDEVKKFENIITPTAIAMCLLTAIFYCYEYYLRVAPSVMCSELKQAFSLTDTAFGHLAACYYYAYTPMQIPVGLMMDKFGPRKILTLACLISVLGTYLFASTGLVDIAKIGRFLVGFGSAFAYVGVLKISDVWLPKKYFALMAGLATTLGMAGAISGQIMMAYMVNHMGWQSTLFYSVAVGGVLTLILWFILRDHVPQHHKTFIANDEEKVNILRGLLEMLRNRSMWVNGLIGCLAYLPLSAFAELWAVPFLESVGFIKEEAAMGSSMVLLGFAIGGPIVGLFSDKVKSRRLPLAMGVFLSALFMLFLILMPSTSKLWMFTLLFCVGLFASVEILVFAVSNDLNRKGVAATAVAFTNMVVMLGGVFLPPLIGKILDYTKQFASAGENTFVYALVLLPIALILAGILSLCMKESYRP